MVERFGLFLRMVTQQPLTPTQQASSLWLGVALLLLGAIAAILSALQFRSVIAGLGEKEIPRGYWTNLGVWANFTLAAIALAVAAYFVSGA